MLHAHNQLADPRFEILPRDRTTLQPKTTQYPGGYSIPHQSVAQEAACAQQNRFESCSF
jgi:hypothetical protein